MGFLMNSHTNEFADTYILGPISNRLYFWLVNTRAGVITIRCPHVWNLKIKVLNLGPSRSYIYSDNFSISLKSSHINQNNDVNNIHKKIFGSKKFNRNHLT